MDPTPDDFVPVAQPGSLDYYVLLFSPTGQREKLRALLALEAMLSELGAATLEPQVRHSKLAWWAEELTRFQSGRPVHPVLKSLNQPAGLHERIIVPARDLFFATAREATEELPETPEQLLEHAGQGGAMVGAMAMLLSEAGSPVSAHHPALVDLARARYLVMRLGASHRCEPSGSEPERHAALLGTLAQTVYDALATRLSELEPKLIRAWRPLVVMAAMLRKPLARLGTAADARDRPLSHLLLAWTSARQAARGRIKTWPPLEKV